MAKRAKTFSQCAHVSFILNAEICAIYLAVAKARTKNFTKNVGKEQKAS
jgi:hypothetical protein